MVDALVFDALFDLHQLAERHEAAGGPGDVQILYAVQVGTAGTVQADHEGHVFLGGIDVQQSGRITGGRHLQGAGDLVFGDAVERGLLFVHEEAILRLVVLHVPIHVHHAIGAFPQVANLSGDTDAALLRRSVDLGHQGLKNRRTGRHLGHLDARAKAFGDGQEAKAHLLGDLVALQFAVVLAEQVYLNIGDVRAAAQIIVAHQAVEVIRGCGAHVSLQVDHFGLLQRGGGERAGYARGFGERGSVGHVHDDLKLALVVERQHLDLDELEIEQGTRAEQQEHDTGQESPAQRRVVQDRAHHPAVEPGESIFALAVFARGRRLQNPDRGPRRHDQRHQQGEDHGGAGADGDRPHVRPHQAADKRHRQDGGDHGEGRQDGGIAHLIDGLDGDLERRAGAVRRHAPVTDDVFHHHDGVVHQNADREDQGEERDPVQRVAVQIEHGKRERECHRDGEEYDEGLAQAQRDGDQEADRDHRDQHVQQQFVRFLGGGFAVLAGDVQR